jgi:hypothetical protein
MTMGSLAPDCAHELGIRELGSRPMLSAIRQPVFDVYADMFGGRITKANVMKMTWKNIVLKCIQPKEII